MNPVITSPASPTMVLPQAAPAATPVASSNCASPAPTIPASAAKPVVSGVVAGATARPAKSQNQKSRATYAKKR